MLDYPDIKARLDEARTIRLPFRKTAAVRPLGKRIALEWVWFLLNYRKRSRLFEAYIMSRDDVRDAFTLDYMQRGVELLDSYIADARAAFTSGRVGFFLNCRVVPREIRRKHWAMSNLSNANIRVQSDRTKESMFVREFNKTDALAGLRIAMAHYFDRMWAHKLRFVAVDYEEEVGFSKGQPAHWMAFDIDYSTPQAHCYPISEGEAASLKQVALSTYNLEWNPKRGGGSGHMH